MPNLNRKEVDYTKFGVLLKFLHAARPSFVINAAGHVGNPNVDACEESPADTIHGNIVFPQTVAHACSVAGVPWGHVSSGCIYSGAKIHQREIHDLTTPESRRIIQEHPDAIEGYTESDPPNFTFRILPCSFYSGTKALAEEVVLEQGQSYAWRLRIPFDELNHPRNYLTKLQHYPKVYDNLNSLSHLGDFARACLDLWQLRAPFGVYNVTNPGFVTTRHVVGMIQRILKPARSFDFWADDAEFYRCGAKTPRSNCVLDASKLLAAGVEMRPVEEALEDALTHWRTG